MRLAELEQALEAAAKTCMDADCGAAVWHLAQLWREARALLARQGAPALLDTQDMRQARPLGLWHLFVLWPPAKMNV